MKKFFLLNALAFLCFAGSLSAQTTLSAGDISVIGYRADGPDGFAFVTWVDLAAGTQIRFTDNGWFASGAFATTENDMGWTNSTGSTIVAGTVIAISSPSSTSTANIGTTTGGLDGLSNSGDQVFAYQGSLATPSLIFGLNMNGTGWTADRTSSNNSALPSALASANVHINHVDNAEYNGARSSNTVANHKTAVADASNWATDNDGTIIVNLNATAFTIGAGGGPVLTPVSAFAASANGEDEISISWNKPTGTNGVDWTGVMVFMSEYPFSNFSTNNPSALSAVGNFSFGGGTQVSADGSNPAFCVYNSAADANGNIAVDGLVEGTTYYLVAYSYQGTVLSAEVATNVTTDAAPVTGGTDLILTGIMDGPLSGGTPKVLELYAANSIADLSQYSLYVYSNGGTTGNLIANLPAVSLNAGDFYYVASEAPNFTAFFGFAPDHLGSVFINGDDAVELRRNGVGVDAIGTIGVDGTGLCWDHLDGWAYRANGTSASTTFDCADWLFSGIDALDNATSNATASTPFPIGTYSSAISTADLVITEIMASSALSNSAVNGDWFEIRNNGASAVNMTGFSWDDDSKIAGNHTFGNVTLQPGASLIILDEDQSNAAAWLSEWGQASNGLTVVARDLMGFSGLGSSGDALYLWDASNNLLDSIVFGASTSGRSLEIANGVVLGNATAGVNGAYASLGGDVASPGDMTANYPVINLYNISQINGMNANGVADSTGLYCKLTGVVYTPDFRSGNGYSFHIMDATGGINVFKTSDVGSYQVTEGDSIRVVGSLTQFRGLFEILPDSIVVLAQGRAYGDPEVVTTMGEGTENMLIRFNNVSLVDTAQWTNTGSGFNVDFVTENNDTLVMRIQSSTNVYGTPAPTGTFSVIGVGSQFASSSSSPWIDGYQLLPRYLNDFVVCNSHNLVSNPGVSGNYNQRFNWDTIAGATTHRLQYRMVGNSVWSGINEAGTQRLIQNLAPGNYEARVYGVGVADTSCVVNFSIGCATDIMYATNVFQAAYLDALPASSARVTVFNLTGGKSLYSFELENLSNNNIQRVDGRRNNTFSSLTGANYVLRVYDAFGCQADSVTPITIEALDTAYIPYLISAVNSSPNGFRPLWNRPRQNGVLMPGVSSYQLRVRNETDNQLVNVFTGVTDTFLSVNNLTPGKLYRFNVRSRYNAGFGTVNSAYSIRRDRSLGAGGNKTELANDAVLVYPNPTQNAVYVNLGAEGRIELLDLNGRVLNIAVTAGEEVSFDLSNLANGVYNLRITNAQGTVNQKVVKQ